MNNNFNDAKEFFDKNGYCSFSLKDFDVDFYNFLDEFLSCDTDKNLSEMFYSFRFDSDKKSNVYRSEIQTFEDAKKNYLEALKDDEQDITQAWFWQNNTEHVQTFLENKYPILKNINVKRKIIKSTNNILKYFYENLDDNNIIHDELHFSLYDIGSIFVPHSDGVTVNLCSILIYLNKNYNKDNGGLLSLNNEEIVPELGTVALMDLSKHDIKHGVSKVVSGPGRYAIFNFPKLKNIV